MTHPLILTHISWRNLYLDTILTFAPSHYLIHYHIAHQNLFIHEFLQNQYVSTTICVFTNLVKAQLSPPTSYSP